MRRLKSCPYYSLIDDTIKEMERWACFQPEYQNNRKPVQNSVKPRFGKVGKKGSISVVERCIRALKELLR